MLPIERQLAKKRPQRKVKVVAPAVEEARGERPVSPASEVQPPQAQAPVPANQQPSAPTAPVPSHTPGASGPPFLELTALAAAVLRAV